MLPNAVMPVRGPMIQQQALEFARDLNNDTFIATYGWLDSFLKRNNIAKLWTCECLSVAE